MGQIQIYDAAGKSRDQLSLDSVVTEKKMAPHAFACAVKVLMQNWRQGTVSSKGRSDVSFSGKKPWRQKGTGRARAGTISSPLWRKGGVIFGPQPRSKKLKITRKQRSLVMNNVLFSMQSKGGIYCLDFALTDDKPSTKQAAAAIRALELNKKKVLLFLTPTDLLHNATFRNLSNVRIISFDQPNAYDLANAQAWIFLKQDSEHFNDMVKRWN